MTVYGLLDFQGYADRDQATKFARLSQMVDNPGIDRDSVEYLMFEYGKERTLNYQVTSDREDIPNILHQYPQARIIRIVSYSPIITPRIALALKLRATTLDEIHKGQILRCDDGLFVDQFGLSVCVQNLLVLDGNGVQDQDWRYMDDCSNVIVEGDVRTLL